jgi:HSP20 family protein
MTELALQTYRSRLMAPVFFEPAARAHETDDAVRVSVDVPGLDAEDIDITLDAGTLHIVGRRGERTCNSVVTVGSAIDVDRITTKLEHGVLTINLPKLASAKPRRIAINARTKPTESRWRRWFGRRGTR